MRILAYLAAISEAQRGTLVLWMPLGLGAGIGLYFLLRFEPGLTLYMLVGGLSVAALVMRGFCGGHLRRALVALALIGGGFCLAGASAHLNAAPVLSGHYSGPLEGRVIALDRSRSNDLRITLDHLWLARRTKSGTPRKVRITLHYPKLFFPIAAGQRVMLTARLSPPAGPVEPGGFNFRRYAWFRGLGAVGYTKTPLLRPGTNEKADLSLRLIQARMRMAAAIRARLHGPRGAFAAAILTGDRSAIAPDMMTLLRNANLAHLLAISGLHMGLLTGFVFALFRYGLALIPPLALRLPVKKVAAVAAFLAAILYLLLSGANIATQRAFVMVAVALVAVLLDRRALTLRAVALAAVIVLLIRPVSLIEAGFQMSFAATTALVATFSALRGISDLVGPSFRGAAILRWGLALILSSLVAGLATAPISAFYFNRIAEYGLIANLASVPVMGFVVMPAAVCAVLLAPFGLDGPFWQVSGAGIDWILWVAGQVSAWPGAVLPVQGAPWQDLVLILGGALGVILLRGPIRLLGIAPVLAGFLLWHVAERPVILLSDNGRLLGVLQVHGRWLNKARGEGFAAQSWLEKDGDTASQKIAAARQIKRASRDHKIEIGTVSIRYSARKSNIGNRLCQGVNLLILPRQHVSSAGCKVLDASDFRRNGAISAQISNGKIVLTNAREVSGRRLWTPEIRRAQ